MKLSSEKSHRAILKLINKHKVWNMLLHFLAHGVCTYWFPSCRAYCSNQSNQYWPTPVSPWKAKKNLIILMVLLVWSSYYFASVLPRHTLQLTPLRKATLTWYEWHFHGLCLIIMVVIIIIVSSVQYSFEWGDISVRCLQEDGGLCGWLCLCWCVLSLQLCSGWLHW